ncbi:hypothetical protein MLD38_004471 [Melastoma candidum]|uniref:Uncharacterized protein n=1 Tax=Melastoma candidum TaxID=119954 RepID=A0ACB9S670_9MYRT|nr:hypothetical protein MLD38_004471 [Melastoma candidum]
MNHGVRKGAWTNEEDDLLRKCVESHGEGKWNLVPGRAGLNRCRKSCRMRWLNYLKPNIKRGVFEEDEVVMIIRLHKLLGNKYVLWSLIAGRIPGRTSNHVKNFWNIRSAKQEKEKSEEKSRKIAKVDVIKPRPRTFSKGLSWLSGKATLITCAALGIEDNSTNNNNNLADEGALFPLENEVAWWKGLLGDMDDLNVPAPTFMNITEESPVGESVAEMTKTVDGASIEDDWFADSPFDIDLWQL